MEDDTVKSLCNRCLQETDHTVVWKHISDVEQLDIVSHTRTLAVYCRGCKECAIREEEWYFDYVPDSDSHGTLRRVSYRPARLWHRPPSWLASLEEIDSDLKGLLDEVYSATNDQQTRLLSMGVRSVLDRVMTTILDRDSGSFEQKLKEMVAKDHLSERQRKDLEVVIDAGSASTHRGFRPDRHLIEEMVVVMEGIVRAHYITGPMLNTAKRMIPPRPTRDVKASTQTK